MKNILGSLVTPGDSNSIPVEYSARVLMLVLRKLCHIYEVPDRWCTLYGTRLAPLRG
jgi:hypothetical protein